MSLPNWGDTAWAATTVNTAGRLDTEVGISVLQTGITRSGNGSVDPTTQPDQVASDAWLDHLPAYNHSTDLTGPSLPLAGDLVSPVIAKNQHFDYHFRLWVIPPLLQLSNPQLNTNIGFRLWNTWTDSETITSVQVQNSIVLTFDVTTGTVLSDGAFRNVNMQIGPGEPTVDATVIFNTENLSGELRVIALISDTFNIIPDVPVVERWRYLTDVIETYNGQEQRIALRRNPRLEQDFDVEIIDLRQRRDQYQLLTRSIRVQALVPQFQYATPLTQETPIGGNRVYFDPKYTNMRVGQFFIGMNPTNEKTVLGRITTLHADGATLQSSAGEPMTTHWLAVPGINCNIENGSGITMQNVTGRMKIQAKSIEEPEVLRPGATRSVEFIDGIPFIARKPIIPAEENLTFRKEILDNQTGKRELNSAVPHPRWDGVRRFIIQRQADPDEMDYWRSVFDTVRGGQKGFLLSTHLPDLTLNIPMVQGASSMIVNEDYYPELYFPYNTWRHIEMEHAVNGGTLTHHTVTNSIVQGDGTAIVSFSPALPEDTAYNNPERISYLKQHRIKDSVVFRHFANYTEVSFETISTDQS